MSKDPLIRAPGIRKGINKGPKSTTNNCQPPFGMLIDYQWNHIRGYDAGQGVLVLGGQVDDSIWPNFQAIACDRMQQHWHFCVTEFDQGGLTRTLFLESRAWASARYARQAGNIFIRVPGVTRPNHRYDVAAVLHTGWGRHGLRSWRNTRPWHWGPPPPGGGDPALATPSPVWK